MNQFKLNKITGALIAAGLALPTGYALAADNTPSVSDRGPRQGAAMFVGQDGGSQVRVATTTTAAEAAAPSLSLHFFNGSTAVCTPQTITDGGGDATTGLFQATLAAGCTTDSFNGVVLVYEAAGGDTIGTENTFAVVTAAGALGAGSTTSAAALAAANTASALAVRANYIGPIVTAASQTGVGAVSLTFNAALSGSAAGTGNVGGAGTAPTANVVAYKTVNNAGINSAVGGGTAAAAAGVETLSVGAANFGGGSYTSAVHKVEIFSPAANIYDTAGNQAPSEVVRTNFSGTSGVAFASGTAKALVALTLADDTAAVNAWNPTLSTQGQSSGTFQITLRLNEEMSGNFDTSAVSITPAMGAITDNGTVNGTDRLLTVAIPGGTELGFNSSGQLVASTGNNNWAAAPTAVTIGLTHNTSNILSVTLSGTQITTSGVAPVAVMSDGSNLPSAEFFSLDSDINGLLDGATLRSHNVTGLAYSPAAPGFSTAAGTSLTVVGDNGTNPTFASTLTVNSTVQVNVVMNGTNNDWNGDGTVGNGADLALFDLTSLGTGLTNPIYSVRNAAVTATTAASALNYSQAFRGTDGELLPVNNNETAATQSAFVDNAPPVLVFVEYVKQNDQGETPISDSQPRDEFGDVRLVFSETIEGPFNLGSILMNGTPVSLKNLNANIPSEVGVALGNGTDPFSTTAETLANNQVTLSFMPNVVGQVVSFPAGQYNTGENSNINEVGGGTPDYMAVVNSQATRNTASLANPPFAFITGARLRPLYVPGTKMDVVIVDYSEAVAANAGANLNGVFVVRAQVGSLRGSAFQDRTNDNRSFDFIIPAANVAIGTNGVGGANSVTLTIPDNTATKGLPGDTVAIYVDYQPWGTNDVNRLNRASDGTPLPNPDANRFATAANATVGVDDPVTTVINIDEDTVTVDFDPVFFADQDADSSKKLMTMTVLGDLERAGVGIIDNVGIRADLIQVIDDGAGAVAPKEPLLRDGGGLITVRRGPNSEPANNLQTIALVNQAVVQADFANYYKDLRNYNSALKSKVTDAAVTNAQKIDELLRPEIDALRKYDIIVSPGNTTALTLASADGTIQAYVEITTGAGALGSSGNNGSNQSNDQSPDVPGAQNSNAELGRTATLRRSIPNTQRNGTTFYPVQVVLETGEIFPIGSDNPVDGGQLPIIAGQLSGSSASATKRFKILDTAFALSRNANYTVTVGSTEAAFTGAGGPLNPSATGDVFVLISVRDPATGNYTPVTSGDASFVNFVKFNPDLKSNGKPTKLDVDLANIAAIDVKDINGWQIFGPVGELDRNAGAPLDPRAWLSVRENDGAPVTNFAFDNGAKDEAFVLGNDTVANSVRVAFEGSGGSLVNNLRPRSRSGIAFNANATGKAAWAGGADGILNDNVPGWTPTTGAARTTPKLYLRVKATPVTELLLLKNSWHLVTVQTTTRTFVNLPSQVDAAIIVDGQNGATAWFRGEEATQHLDSMALPQGTTLFLHVGASDVPTGGDI